MIDAAIGACEGKENVRASLLSTGPAESGGVAFMRLGITISCEIGDDTGWAVRGVSGYVMGREDASGLAIKTESPASANRIAVTGSAWSGVERSIAVTYTLESVLKAVGDFGLTYDANLVERAVMLVATRSDGFGRFIAEFGVAIVDVFRSLGPSQGVVGSCVEGTDLLDAFSGEIGDTTSKAQSVTLASDCRR